MTTTLATVDEAKAVVQPTALEVSTHLREATNFLVTTQDLRVELAERRKIIKGALKATEEKRKSLVDPLNKVVKDINALFKPLSTSLEQADSLYERKAVDWDREQERLRQEAERRALEAARKEQERLDRIAREQAEKAAAKAREEQEKAEALRREAAAKAAQEADARRAEEIRRQAEAKAQALEQKAANLELKAEEIIQAVPQVVVQPSTLPPPPKIAGESKRKQDVGVVTDKMAFIQGIAAGIIPLDCVEIVQGKLNDAAKLHKEALNDWPGCRYESKDILGSTAA